ncbi:MAG TPA: hypothetical protein DDZ80_31105 [Cyanobacteria bacterium UBA8803]|nr:hypothetical protein [Cyanobacteria bacterium UBA9273]HBL62669.1 hypothetical protein [Cyanobacteria bacterium UBA8803]
MKDDNLLLKSKANILVVSDKPKDLQALLAILSRCGLNIVQAHAAEDASICLMEQEFGAIVLDVSQPKIRWEIVSLIQARLNSVQVPMIVLAANHEDISYGLENFTLSEVDYWVGPIVPEILSAKVAQSVASYQKTQQITQQAAQLAAVNQQLNHEIAKRQQVEAELQSINEDLERRVAERTTKLKQVNQQLRVEIAQRQQVEAFLRKSEQLYRTLVETIPHGIKEIDTNGIIVFCNGAYQRMLGYSETELLGKTLWDLTPEAGRSQWCRDLAQLVQKQPPAVPYQEQYLTKDGNLIDIQVDWNYKRDEVGQVIGFISVVTDITEQKRSQDIRTCLESEQELRKLQLRFFSMASHELRTPLSIILGSTQLLKSCDGAWPTEKRDRNLYRLETAAKNMAQLLDDLLTVGRAESGTLEFHLQSIDLKHFCQSLVEDLQRQAGAERKITFVSEGQCPTACMDRTLLYYILKNLLSNATTYSPVGSQIQLTLTCQESDAIFTIQNRGIDILLEDHHNYLFELFNQEENNRNIPGSRLGLMLIKKCLDLQGGKIHFDSQVSSNTIATVTIPIMANS